MKAALRVVTGLMHLLYQLIAVSQVSAKKGCVSFSVHPASVNIVINNSYIKAFLSYFLLKE